MESLKKIATFFALFLIVIGAITSLIIVGQNHQWLAFIGECLVIAGAVPTIVKLLKFLIK